MNKKSKIIVALTMIMTVMSFTAICFTFAWYDIFPKYHNISLSTGKESLHIHSNVFLRTRDASGQATFSENDNYKFVKSDGTHQIGPDNPTTPITQPSIEEGVLTVNFNDLAFSIFGTKNDNGVIAPGGTLDESNMTWNMDYLTFALIECRFYNKFFPAYLNVEYFSSSSVFDSANSGASIPADAYNIDQLFTINVVEDTTVEGNKTQMCGLISDKSSNPPTPANPDSNLIHQLENNVVSPTTSAKYLNSDEAIVNGLFMSNDPTPVNRQIEINPNSNVDANNTPCYSYAFTVALGINVLEIVKIMGAPAFKPSIATTLNFNLKFITQNTKGATA